MTSPTGRARPIASSRADPPRSFPMKTRKISLTCLHAINWYGYADSIPVAGNLLLAGVTGSGKSILMDLLQFVLVGDQRLVRFNQSATGDRGDRSIKGYCLGDTKEEDNGVTQYMRGR